MVKSIILILGLLLPTTFCGSTPILLEPDTEILFVSKYCGACKEAVIIIERLQKQGYDCRIIDMHGSLEERAIATHYQVSSVPTYVIRLDGFEINRFVGLKDEGIYRAYTSKKSYSQDPINLDNFTGAVNFTNNEEPTTLVYSLIVRRAKRSQYGYVEYNPYDRTDLAEKYQITKLPTLLLLKEGVEVGRYIGVTPYAKEKEEKEEVDAESGEETWCPDCKSKGSRIKHLRVLCSEWIKYAVKEAMQLSCNFQKA